MEDQAKVNVEIFVYNVVCTKVQFQMQWAGFQYMYVQVIETFGIAFLITTGPPPSRILIFEFQLCCYTLQLHIVGDGISW